MITDISENGCQLARNLEIAPGSVIALSFGGYVPVEAVVMWTSPAAFGLCFDAPLHSAVVAQVVSAGQGRRRARKLTSGLVRREEREKLWHLALPVSLTVAADTGSSLSIVGELRDLSVEGCRINTDVAMLPGTEIAVSLAGPEPVRGSVRWYEAGGAGIRFDEPLPPPMIERIAGRPSTAYING